MKYYIYLDKILRKYFTVAIRPDEVSCYNKEMVFDSQDMAEKFCFLMNRIQKLEDKLG